MRLTLQDAIARAQSQGLQARAAKASRDAARQRDRAFGASRLPQMALTGTVPSLNRSIIPCCSPTAPRCSARRSRTSRRSPCAITQRMPLIGGDLFVNSALSRLEVIGNTSSRTWQSTPMLVGIRQDILFRPNRLRWDNREQDCVPRSPSAPTARRWRTSRSTANAFFDYYTAKLGLENAATNAAVNDTLYTLNNGRYEVGDRRERPAAERARAAAGARLARRRAAGARPHARALRLALNLRAGAPLDVIVTPEIPEVEADTAVAVAQALRQPRPRRWSSSCRRCRRTAASPRRASAPASAPPCRHPWASTRPAPMNAVYRDLREAQRFNLGVHALVQWGGRSANIQAAKLDEERVEHTARQSREQTAQEAHFAALQLAQSRRQLAIAAKADTVGAKRFEVAKNRYVIGRIGMDNLYRRRARRTPRWSRTCSRCAATGWRTTGCGA
jgi:hypothetical protein